MLIQIIILLFFANADVLANYFTIIGPSSSYTGTKYRAMLTSTSEDPSKIIKVSFLSKSVEIKSSFFYLKPDVQQEILFDIPEGESNSQFKLKTELFTLTSSFEEDLKVIAKKPTVYVKTNQAIYKYGDKVKYQVFVLDAEMKPYQYKRISITFTDKDKNEVSDSSRTLGSSKTGYLEESFALKGKMSQTRTIHVSVDDELATTKHSFEVAEPGKATFQVFIDPFAKDVTFGSERIIANIYAKYLIGSDGTFVKGKATVKATVFNSKSFDQKLKEISKIIDVATDSSAVSFSFEEDLKMDPNFDSIVKLHLTFQDKLTRRSEITEAVVTVHKDSKYKFEMIGGDGLFVPGQPYNFQALIKNFDGSIVKEKEKASLSVRKQFLKSCTISKTATPSEMGTMHVPELTKVVELMNGVVEFIVNTPIDAESLILKVNLKNSFKDFKIHRKDLRSGKDLELTISAGSLKAGQTINVDVKSTSSIGDLFWVIVGQAGIITQKKHPSVNSKSFNFEVHTDQDMLPVSDLIVYFIKSSGEIVSNKVQLKSSQISSQTSRNHLEIVTASEKVEQGSTTSIFVNTAANSMVGIIAVEHSTGSYLVDSSPIFISNALKDTLTCSSVRETSLGNADASVSSNEAFSSPSLLSSSTKDIWILKSFLVGDNGQNQCSEIVPHKNSFFVISGFSNNAQGLSFAEPQALRTVKNFFVEINAPGTVTLGEVIRVEVFVFNFVKKEVNPLIDVLLSNDDASFAFVEPATETNECSFTSTGVTVKSTVISNGVEKVVFYVRPVKKGFSKLKVKATAADNLDDTSEKNVFVENTRLKIGFEKSKDFNSESKKYDSIYFKPEAPASFVEGSIHSQVQVVCRPENFDEFSLKLEFTYTPIGTEAELSKTLAFNNANASISQNFEIPRTEGLSIQAEGKGIANVRFVQLYLEKPVTVEERFDVDVIENGSGLNICINAKSGSSEKPVVADITLPNGYIFDESSTQTMLKKGVDNIRLQSEKLLVTLMFGSMSTNEVCVDIQLKRKYFVWTNTFSSVRVYEEGKQDRFTIKHYKISSSLTC